MNLHDTAREIGLDWDEFLEMMELFLETTFSDLSTLQEALNRGDTGETVRASHSIKGAGINMGFRELSALAASMEAKARNGTLEGCQETMTRIREELGELEKVLLQHSMIRSETPPPA